MADNFHIDLTAEGEENLRAALRIAFRDYKATGYAVTAEHGLVFFWMAEAALPGFAAFPFKMNAEGAADFAARWLAEANYGREPDHDGDNGRGWRVYTTGWGCVGRWRHSLCAIKPAWMMYGK